MIASSEVPDTPDAEEYPPPGTSRPKPGSIVIEKGEGTPLCTRMVKEAEYGIDGEVMVVDFPPDAQTAFAGDSAHGLYDYAGHFSRQSFDIDNDGTTDTIYGFHPANHAHDADIYFLSAGPDLDRIWPDVSEDDLWRSSPFVFPYHDVVCIGHPCGKDDEDGLLFLPGFADRQKTFAFRFRYLHVTPFFVQGVTYFLLASLDIWSEHVTAVVEPHRHKGPVVTCVFRRVVDNF